MAPIMLLPLLIVVFLFLADTDRNSVFALSDYDQELYNITLADERAHVDTVYTSVIGVVIATTSGIFSSLCSLQKESYLGLATVYHRLIFSLSIFEVSISVAIALTTLPMPKDMIYQQFEGLLLGNTDTCTAQGFFFVLGGTCASMYNCFLLVYYLLSIRYQMKDSTISKLIEPLMHGYALAYGFSISISLIALDAFNPTPYDVWCTAITYPWWCPGTDEACLLRASKKSYTVRNVMLLHFILIAVVMVGSLALVIWTIYAQESLFKMYKLNSALSRFTQTDEQEQFDRDFYYTKTILKQALAYTVAYASINVFPFISIITGRPNNFVLSVTHLSIRPSQGVFNLLIFIYHKIHNISRNEPDISFCDAIRKIFEGGEEPENVISTIYLVRRDEDDKVQEHCYGEEGSNSKSSVVVSKEQNYIDSSLATLENDNLRNKKNTSEEKSISFEEIRLNDAASSSKQEASSNVISASGLESFSDNNLSIRSSSHDFSRNSNFSFLNDNLSFGSKR